MLLLTFHSNYGPILYHFQDEARYLLKITICTPPSFDALISESQNIAIRFGKPGVVWLPDGEKSLRLYLLISTQQMNLMDTRWTYRHRKMA